MKEVRSRSVANLMQPEIQQEWIVIAGDRITTVPTFQGIAAENTAVSNREMSQKKIVGKAHV